MLISYESIFSKMWVRWAIDKESIKAWKDATEINDEKNIPQLMDFILKEKNNDQKYKAYFILANIAKNTSNLEATQFLIDRIEKESNKNLIWNILYLIRDLQKPNSIDISPLIKILDTPNRKLKESEILSLSNSESELAKDCLIKIIDTSKNKYDLIYTNWALWTLKSKYIIPKLQTLLDNPSNDVCSTALRAILKICDEWSLNIFVDQLKKWRCKFMALQWVLEYWNIDNVDIVITRMKNILNSKRWIKSSWVYWTEIVMWMKFLLKFVKISQKPAQTFDYIVSKKRDSLWDEEKQWLEENKQFFLVN